MSQLYVVVDDWPYEEVGKYEIVAVFPTEQQAQEYLRQAPGNHGGGTFNYSIHKVPLRDDTVIDALASTINDLTDDLALVRRALKEIIACDYRGNMPSEQAIAREALAQLERRNP